MTKPFWYKLVLVCNVIPHMMINFITADSSQKKISMVITAVWLVSELKSIFLKYWKLVENISVVHGNQINFDCHPIKYPTRYFVHCTCILAALNLLPNVPIFYCTLKNVHQHSFSSIFYCFSSCMIGSESWYNSYAVFTFENLKWIINI